MPVVLHGDQKPPDPQDVGCESKGHSLEKTTKPSGRPEEEKGEQKEENDPEVGNGQPPPAEQEAKAGSGQGEEEEREDRGAERG